MDKTGGEGIGRFVYPGPVTLTRSAQKWAFVFVPSAALAIAAAWMTLDGRLFPLAGWLSAVVLAVIAVLSGAVLLFPRISSITLGPGGFDVVQVFTRWQSRWVDGSEFSVRSSWGIQTVAFDDRTKKDAEGGFGAAIVRRSGAIPDTYGLGAPELAALMNRWRSAALAAQSSPRAGSPRR